MSVEHDRLAARLRAIFVAELDEQMRTMNVELLALEANPRETERIRALFRVAHTLKGAARAAGEADIERECHSLEALLVEIRDGERSLGRAEFTRLFTAADVLAAAGRRLGDADDGHEQSDRETASQSRAGAAATPVTATAPPGASAEVGTPGAVRDGPVARDGPAEVLVRVDARRLDALTSVAGLLQIAAGRVRDRPRQLETVHETMVHAAAEWSRTSRRVRLALERTGAPPALGASVSRMEEAFRRLAHDTRAIAVEVATDTRAIRVAADAVAAEARRLRMRPFAEACDALPRMVRDLAATAAKEVELEIAGATVEVDRAVINVLRDVLLHLVRNALDHGIEKPTARRRAKKPRRGRIRITAELRGSRVVVTVADDGAGIDPAAVRRQLARRGLPVPTDDRDVVRAVFDSGLSTKPEASIISGRGVGLDIVRTAAGRLRGNVDVSWTAGRGTTFSLECPASVATQRVLLVTVAQQLLAFPTEAVERLLRVRFEDIRHAEGRTVVTTRDGPVPLVALARLLPPLVERPAGSVTPAVLLHADGRRLAVAVDEFATEDEVIVQPFDDAATPLPLVNGAALLPSGRVAILLDTGALIAAALQHGGPGVARGQGTEEARHQPTILVVDDSITTRTLEQVMLEAAGYRVLTAVDGADGWRVLQERGVDVVVADVEMPRMDGFALCEAIRASRRLRTTPVVLVTALESAEHRARGMDAGADAYIGKTGFDQQNLLTTIKQLIGRGTE